MIKKLHISVVLFIIYILFELVVKTVYARDCESDFQCNENDESYDICLQNKIDCIENKLGEINAEKTTLNSTISVFNGNINIQELQIRQRETEITKLEKEIGALGDRISGLSISLDRLTTLLVDRIRTQYKQRQSNPLELLLTSNSLSKFINQHRYLSLAGKQTADAMQRAQDQKVLYDEQKDIKTIKQDEIETKRYQLQLEQNNLVAQREAKKNLLDITQNNEKKYQSLLEESRKELAQILSAANTVIKDGNGIAVVQGEVIGTMGNSGFSSGPHLHFGVYRYSADKFSKDNWDWYYSNYINPLDKLRNQSITWDTGCSNDPSGQQSSGNGGWNWPMSNIRVTQNYGGNTCYNFKYGGKAHPAMDLVGIGDISVKAVADGVAYFCRNCLGDGGNGAFVFHEDNYMTLYWHLK